MAKEYEGTDKAVVQELLSIHDINAIVPYVNIAFEVDDKTRYVMLKCLLSWVRGNMIFDAYETLPTQLLRIVASSPYATFDDKIAAINSKITDNYFIESAILLLRDRMQKLAKKPSLNNLDIEKFSHDTSILIKACEQQPKFVNQIKKELNPDNLRKILEEKNKKTEIEKPESTPVEKQENIPVHQTTLFENELITDLSIKDKKIAELKDKNNQLQVATAHLQQEKLALNQQNESKDKEIEHLKKELKNIRFNSADLDIAKRLIVVLQNQVDRFMSISPRKLFGKDELLEIQKDVRQSQSEVKSYLTELNR